MNQKSFRILARVKSFRHAMSGLWLMLSSQHSAWLHLVATVLACGAGLWLKIGSEDWRWLIAAIALVWICEALNTAFEHLCDVVSPDFHHAVKKSKDIAAGAVLISAIAAACVGALTFWPYLRR